MRVPFSYDVVSENDKSSFAALDIKIDTLQIPGQPSELNLPLDLESDVRAIGILGLKKNGVLTDEFHVFFGESEIYKAVQEYNPEGGVQSLAHEYNEVTLKNAALAENDDLAFVSYHQALTKANDQVSCWGGSVTTNEPAEAYNELSVAALCQRARQGNHPVISPSSKIDNAEPQDPLHQPLLVW